MEKYFHLQQALLVATLSQLGTYILPIPHTQNLKLKVGPNFTFPTKKAVQHQDLPSSKMAPFNTRGVQSSSPYCTLDPDEFQNMISI